MTALTHQEYELVAGTILVALGLMGIAWTFYLNQQPSKALSESSDKPYVTQRLVPSPGRMVVVRERAQERTYGGLFKPDEARDWESRANPFALVVGVGDKQVTQYGTVVETDCREGDKVVLGALGMAVELVSDGKIDFVYVVGFESVVGRLELVCGACGHHERNFAHEIRCQKCGAGAAPELIPEAPSEIVAPSLDDVAELNAERIRSAK